MHKALEWYEKLLASGHRIGDDLFGASAEPPAGDGATGTGGKGPTKNELRQQLRKKLEKATAKTKAIRLDLRALRRPRTPTPADSACR